MNLQNKAYPTAGVCCEMNRINKISIPTILEKKQSVGPMDNRGFLSSFPKYGFKQAEAADAWP